MLVQNVGGLGKSIKKVSFGDANAMSEKDLLNRAKHLIVGNRARLSQGQWDKMAHAVAVVVFSNDPLPPAQYIQEKPAAVAKLRKFVGKYAKIK